MESVSVRSLLAVLLLAVGCASLGPLRSTGGCSETAPVDAEPATADQIPSLTGRFSLVQVTTSLPGEGKPAFRSQLELHRPDTATVSTMMFQRALGQPKDLRLVGSERWSQDHPPEPAEWDAGTLFIGCRNCFDASPTHYRITAISPRGFWGSWIDYQTGTVHVIGKDGKVAPNPAGYFCATRL